jgi:hypothetical protein
MYFEVGIEVIQIFRHWNQLIAESPHYHWSVAIGSILAPLTDVLFIWLVARQRKGWPRWILLLPVVIGIPYDLRWIFTIPIFDLIVVCTAHVAQIVALYLIFTGNAREWFANEPTRRFGTAAISH